MIRCQHKWPVCRQLVAADDRQSMCDGEISSQQRKTNLMREAFQKPAFASHASKPFVWSQAGIVGRLEVPRLHQSLSADENLLLLPNSKTDKVIDVVKHGRRNKDQAVESIENASVSWDEFRGVLEAQVTFD